MGVLFYPTMGSGSVRSGGPGRRGDCVQRLGAAGFPGCTWLAPAAAAPPHPLNPVTGTVVRRDGTDGGSDADYNP